VDGPYANGSLGVIGAFSDRRNNDWSVNDGAAMSSPAVGQLCHENDLDHVGKQTDNITNASAAYTGALRRISPLRSLASSDSSLTNTVNLTARR